MKYRTVFFYRDYFKEFYECQREDVKAKITWTLRIIEQIWRIPESYLKHIEGTDGLYEVRVQLANEILRIFCFFDAGHLIVVINGFQKKSGRTPKKEIGKAIIIKRQYEK
jgi:phage-related protein